jgi:hypothetical protein
MWTPPMALGLVALACWVVYGMFLMLDLYLDYPTARMALRLLVPWVVVCNLVGLVMALVRGRRDGKARLMAGLALNFLPLAVMIGFFVWLIFGFKM